MATSGRDRTPARVSDLERVPLSSRPSKISHLRLREPALRKFKDLIEIGEAHAVTNSLYQRSLEMVFFCDPEGRFIHANDNTQEILGYSMDELSGLHFQTLLPIDKLAAYNDAKRALLETGEQEKPMRMIVRSRKGERLLLSLRPSLLVNGGNEHVTQWNAQLLANLDQQGQSDQEFLQLKSFAAASSQAAHDIRNLLTPSIALLERIMLLGCDDVDYEALSAIKRDARASLAALDRIATISKDMMILAKPKKIGLECTDVTRLLFNLGLRTLAEKKQNINVVRATENTKAYVICDPLMLERAISNIITNGLDAMAMGGRLSISSKVHDASIEIKISDSGYGIPSSELSHIFDPYVSTKKTPGSGLGLAIARRVINDYEGSINVESTMGAGSTFTIVLPCTREHLDDKKE